MLLSFLRIYLGEIHVSCVLVVPVKYFFLKPKTLITHPFSERVKSYDMRISLIYNCCDL